jgi:hypothetical protein
MKANFTHEKPIANNQQNIEMIERNNKNFEVEDKNQQQSLGHA